MRVYTGCVLRTEDLTRSMRRVVAARPRESACTENPLAQRATPNSLNYRHNPIRRAGKPGRLLTLR